MPRYLDFGDLATVAVGLGLGFLTGWVADSLGLSENLARVAAYTVVVFACLAMALRPAWRRLRLWGDLSILLVLHAALILPLVNFLDAHHIRLNWALALPLVMVELFLLLGVLWRRNVT